MAQRYYFNGQSKKGHASRLGALIDSLLLGAALLCAQPALAQMAFRDASDLLPTPHSYEGDWEYYVGGGVAIFDCNHDHLPDLFAAGGSAPAHLYINQSVRGGDLR
ncbi:MAG TPA: hypothetical protein DCK86_09035, partial [Rhodobacter sp.]|nr:hypothetical protein [Rhodobacter sp.]